jgi:hypothetical protein
LAAAVCALLAPDPEPTRAAGWIPAISISTPGSYLDEPEVAVGPDGTGVAVWNRYAEPDYLVEASTRSPGGAWSAPQRLSTTTSATSTPRLAIDAGGTAVVVWRGAQGSSQVTQASIKTRTGAWSAPETISPLGIDAYSAKVAVDPAGNAVVVWRAYKGSEEDSIEAVTRPAGGAWSGAEVLSPGGKDAFEPDIDLDPAGNAVAAWYAYDASKKAIVEAARKPAGAAWGDPDELSKAGQSSSDARVAAGPTGTVVAWRRQGMIQALRGTPGPPWPATATDLTTGEENVSEPRVDVDGAGNAVVLWSSDPKPGVDNVIREVTHPAAGAFGAPQTISAAGGSAYYPALSVSPISTAAAATWAQEQQPFRLTQAALGGGPGTWSVPTPISPIDRTVNFPDIAVDPAGNALAVWRVNEGTNEVIQIASYDATGPEIGQIQIAKRPRAGRPIAFSAAVTDDFSALGPISWSFGDGSTAATGASVKHAFRAHGKFKVTVSSIDAAGNAASSTETVAIGRALASSRKVVRVRKGRAQLALNCAGSAICTGTVKLTTGGPGKRRAKRSTTLGKGKFKIRAGRKKTVAVKLKPTALETLREKGRLRARLSGNAVEPRAVVLKPAR